jgi:hypothetical protein
MNLTIVSGFINVHHNKYSLEKYYQWFKTSLLIPGNVIFFGTPEILEYVKTIRPDFFFVEYTLEECYSYKYKESIQTDPVHCPSKELCIVWNEKICMLQKASKMNPFNTDYFIWIDAALPNYREKVPPAFGCLPEINFSKDHLICTKLKPFFNKNKTSYNPFITGGNLLVHKDFIDKFSEIYARYIDTLLPSKIICTDEIVLTHIYKDCPELFEVFKYGYGSLVRYLFENSKSG